MRLPFVTRGFICLVIPTLVLAQSKPTTGPIPVKVVTDRPDATYHAGETVAFKVSVIREETGAAERKITYVLTNDGEDRLAGGTLPVTGEIPPITGKLDAPGFLRCQVTYVDSRGKKHSATAAAGVDPLRIKPSMPPPDDFDAFWSEQKRKLSEVPMDPVLTPVPSPQDDLECFDVRIQCLGGMPVSGYLARPKGAKPKSLPAILSVHGAGVASSNLSAAVSNARFGALGMDINAHGIPNGQPKAFYAELANGKLKNYRLEGRESRDTYYFLGMYLRLIRAMEFLTSQPEWDGRTLIVHGSSQGGGQSIVAAGLEPRVTAFAANVPAMCDHTGKVNGWPRLVPRGADGTPDPKVLQAARYFDAMNFAARTRAEAVVSVGFIDDTCRPTSVYAAFNNLKGPKRMINEPMMTHANWPSYANARDEMIRQHIRKMNASVQEKAGS